MTLFRWDSANAHVHNPYKPRNTSRPPGNVPYLVDNLWEWCRPPEMPSRRHSVFASPTPELARQSGGAANGAVFTVKTTGARIAQIAAKDAKFHPESDPTSKTNLVRVVARMFHQTWFDLPMADRSQEALLWSPCLKAQDTEKIIAQSKYLGPRRDELRELILFWKDATLVAEGAELPHAEGEVFFEAAEWVLELPKEKS